MRDPRALRETVERERERFGVAGLSVVVVAERQVVLAEGFGHRDLERDLPVTPQTLFAIASDTKAFTAALCATLVDEGRLDWDAPVRDVLPWFRLQDPHASALVSVRDLLAHRTGLPRHDALWTWGGPGLPPEEVVRRLRHLEPSAPLRAAWQYNNNGYTTAGYLAGLLAGSDWESALRERLLTPLGMQRTTPSRPAAERTGDAAVPYDDRTGQNRPVPQLGDGSVGPAGGLWSNAEEMARWVLARLGEPLPDGTSLLSPAALRALHSPAMVKPPGPLQLPGVHSLGYALGADVQSYRGHLLVHHGGNLHGFCSDVYLAPDQGHAVVVLANATSSGVRTAVPLALLDALLGLEPQPWGEQLHEAERSLKTGTREAGAHQRGTALGRPATRPLAAYVGTYEHPAYDVLEVRLVQDRLVPDWHGLQGLELRHRDYDTWDLVLPSLDEDLALPAHFRFGPDGVVGVEVPLEPTVPAVLFARRPPQLDAQQLARLAGRYVSGPLEVVVSVQQGELRAAVLGGSPVVLVPDDDRHFRVAGGSGTRVEFVLHDGAVHSVVVHPVGVFTPAVE